jgi:protein-S-isoprenylcysteine O-methyltransferase Ste14
MALTGLALMLASVWMLAMMVVFALVIHFGMVKREERYLEGRFGNAYRRYCEAVPRYGLPF